MKLVVTGSRDGRPDVWQELERFVAEHGPPSLVIVGDAYGVDERARVWADARGFELALYCADWLAYGAKAGPLRNQLMVDEAEPGDWCIALPGPRSRGTWDCIERAVKRGLRTLIVPFHP